MPYQITGVEKLNFTQRTHIVWRLYVTDEKVGGGRGMEEKRTHIY